VNRFHARRLPRGLVELSSPPPVSPPRQKSTAGQEMAWIAERSTLACAQVPVGRLAQITLPE
jgi:hypothetical protein